MSASLLKALSAACRKLMISHSCFMTDVVGLRATSSKRTLWVGDESRTWHVREALIAHGFDTACLSPFFDNDKKVRTQKPSCFCYVCT
jgi:hypothetical protein